MADIAEYEYETKLPHLTSTEALERFNKARKDYPNALVTLNDLDCGHWKVEIYTTKVQKEKYLRSYWTERIGTLFSALQRSIS
jgi:hypothetical protein